MNDLVLLGLAGFAASFVDGALGMGFGPTSSSILLSSGLSPAGVSASVNIAKVATGLVAAAAHWRFENVDRQLVWRLAIPGTVGALIGATILANVEGNRLRPILALLLIVVGLRILLRFSEALPSPPLGGSVARPRVVGVELAGGVGGVTNGLIGAWGPVVTPFLLHHGVAARYAVGSANTAEIAVAFVAAGSLLTSGGTAVEPASVAAMLVGGVVASPIAAWSVRFVPARVLGLLVAALLLTANVRELSNWYHLGVYRWLGYAAIALVVAIAAARPRLSVLSRGSA